MTRCAVDAAAIRAEPRDDAEQVTQALLGEPLRVERRQAGWARVVTAYDYPGWLRERALEEGEGAPPPPPGAEPLELAHTYVGSPYEWGGLTRRGIDCSGLVHIAFRLAGRLVPRDAWQQEAVGHPGAGRGRVFGRSCHLRRRRPRRPCGLLARGRSDPPRDGAGRPGRRRRGGACGAPTRLAAASSGSASDEGAREPARAAGGWDTDAAQRHEILTRTESTRSDSRSRRPPSPGGRGARACPSAKRSSSTPRPREIEVLQLVSEGLRIEKSATGSTSPRRLSRATYGTCWPSFKQGQEPTPSPLASGVGS